MERVGTEEKVGRHVSIAGGISNSFRNAAEIGCNTMQIFLSSPQMWKIDAPSKEQSGLFKKYAGSSDVSPVFVHMPYLPNLASPKKEMYVKSVDTLVSTARLCDDLGIGYIVVHLGSHLGEGKEKGIKNVAAAVGTALDSSENVCILLEDQARQTNSVGADINDLKQIYDGIKSRKAGICLDTCHLFAAGYDIREHKVLDEIDRTLGFRNVKLVHLNDAQFGLSSYKDRHERIGAGSIGIEGFKSFFSYKRLSGIPMVMETPHDSRDSEAREIELVRKLMKQT